MIIGIGSDIVEVARIRGSWQRHEERFLNRVFSSAEQAYCLAHKDPAERLPGAGPRKRHCLRLWAPVYWRHASE